jgi:predicted TIM-barrel fold metal-dependent hydrolase
MIRAAVDMVGEHHTLFGPDFPVMNIEGIRKMVSKIRSFDLGKEVKDKILGANAACFLRMDCASEESLAKGRAK